jgi:hypothetical protein
LEDGTLGVQEGDGDNSFSLGTGQRTQSLNGKKKKKTYTKKLRSRLNLKNSFSSETMSRVLSTNVNIKIYKNIILSVVLYVYETSYPILREEHRLRAFKNTVLRSLLYLNLKGKCEQEAV